MSDGVRLGARFSLATNRLNYCGPEGAEELLHRAIVTGEGVAEAQRALARFEALVPYLDAIASKHGLDRFDPEVVEAYWIGNALLDPFERSDFVRILEGLVQRGLPRALADRLAAGLPERPLPHHMFHVAYVGVGNVTGHVTTTLANIEACRPAWATVTTVGAGRLGIDRPALITDGDRLALGAPQRSELAYDPRLLPNVRPDDSVAVHWGMPVLQLSEEQLQRLRYWTLAALDAVGHAGGGFPRGPG